MLKSSKHSPQSRAAQNCIPDNSLNPYHLLCLLFIPDSLSTVWNRTVNCKLNQRSYRDWTARGIMAQWECARLASDRLQVGVTRWAELCSGGVVFAKALYPQVHSLDPGVSGYLVGQGRLQCVWIVSSAMMAAGLYAPQELRWHMNEQVLWPRGNCVKWVISNTRYQTINNHLHLDLTKFFSSIYAQRSSVFKVL